MIEKRDVKNANEIPDLDYSSLSDEELIRLEQEYETNYIKFNTYQLAAKILLNSLYGALGNISFRYYDIALAESVTMSGKLSIKWIERKLNELVSGWTGIKKDRIVLIDTDSVVLNLEDLIKQKCPNKTREEQLKYIDILGEKIINPFIEKSYCELAEYMNAYEQKMHMKRENIINTMLSCAAKSYMMEVYNSEGVQYSLENPYMKIMGLKIIKSDLAEPVRKILRGAIPILLHGNEEDIQDYVSESREKFKNLTVEEIAFPRGVSDLSKYRKSFWEYELKHAKTANEINEIKKRLDTTSSLYIKGAPIHVKASLVYNKMIDDCGLGSVRTKVADRDKIKFVYLKDNPIGENVIGFQESFPKEFGLEKYIDYDMMFEKAFMSTLRTMTDPIGWETKKTNNLMDFFN